MLGSMKKSSLVIFSAYFIQWFSVGLSYPLFSFFLFHKEMQFVPVATSDAIRGLWLGILFALLSLVQFISAPILGTLSDRKGRKSILQLGYLLNLIGSVITVIAVVWEDLTLLLISRLFLGVAAGNTGVLLAIIADVSSPDQMAKNFGLLNAFRGIGYAAGSFFSAMFALVPLFTFTGIEKPFVVAAIGATICLLLIFFWFDETFVIAQKIKTSFFSILEELKTGLQIRQINILLVTVFVFCFGWSFYWEFIPVTWIEALKVNPAQVGTLYAYGIAFNAIASAVLIRPFFDRFSNGKILLFSTLLLGFYIFILLFKLSIPFLWIFIPIQQYLMALIYPASMAMISNLASKEVQGQTLGMFQSIKGLAYTFSPFSGVLLGISYKVPIAISGSCMILASIIIWLFFRKKIFQRRGL